MTTSTYQVSSGQTLGGITLHSGDAAYVYSSGTTTDITVDGGAEYVSEYGSAIGTTLSSGGGESVSAHGVAISTTVSNGGYEYVAGAETVGQSGVTLPRPVASTWMRALACAGFVESSKMPSSFMTSGVPSGSTKIAGETFCSGSPTVSSPAAA